MKRKHVKKTYSNDDISVLWDSALCEHSGICLRNSPKVFNLKQRPWINIDGESAQQIRETVAKCPSGALSIVGNAADRPVEDPIEITVVPNGPLRLKGAFALKDMDGNTTYEQEVASLCRCGASLNKPFCDGTHRKVKFEG